MEHNGHVLQQQFTWDRHLHHIAFPIPLQHPKIESSLESCQQYFQFWVCGANSWHLSSDSRVFSINSLQGGLAPFFLGICLGLCLRKASEQGRYMIQVWVMKDVRRGYHTLNILSLMKSSSLLTSLSIIKMKVINIRTVSNVPTRPVYLKYHVHT